MSRGTVALTGGTGFVGRVCAAALVAAGWRVRLLVRRHPIHPVLATTPVELVLGDLADEMALLRLVRGVDAVVHAAGTIRGRDAAAFMPVNRDATGLLAAIAAQEVPASRFVLLSSQAARAPFLSPYAASKHAGELAVMAASGGMSAIILRPGVVYGPWDEGTQALLRLANLAIVPVPSAPEPRLSMIHVTDLAAAVVAFCAGGPTGVVHEICDAAADGHGWRQIVEAATSRRTTRFVSVPDAAVLAAGRAADAWSALTRTPSLFGSGKAREILHRDWRPDAARRPPATVWQPAVEIATGFRSLRG